MKVPMHTKSRAILKDKSYCLYINKWVGQFTETDFEFNVIFAHEK